MPKATVNERDEQIKKNMIVLYSLIKPVPDEWKTDKKASQAEPETPKTVCENYKELQLAWRKALRWTDGLDGALAVMLASVSSTMSIGDQLWVKVLSPAASGKSTLCEALSTNKKYVVAKSTIRGFHSGWKGGKGEGSFSLIEEIDGKTLITKDGDTLLQSPNIKQIFSEGRDLYDTVSRSHYRHGMGKDYTGVRMTWILCGTNSLKQIDASELGERFIDYSIMDEIDDELEDEILWRVVNRVDKAMAQESNGQMEGQYDPELVKAMQMTGYYVGWLREHANEQLGKIHASDKAKRWIGRLGKFTAFMRARPHSRQGKSEESQEREFATRLVSQYMRLAKCLALVLNKTEVDAEVMARVRKCATDTSKGFTFSITQRLMHNTEGLDIAAISYHTGLTSDRVRGLLRYLKTIHVVEVNDKPSATGAKTKQTRWILTDKLQRLSHEALNQAHLETI